MGRKSAPPITETFDALNQKAKADRESKEERAKRQWDDMNKYVPIYELNKDEETAAKDDTAKIQRQKKRKRHPVRNAGESSKGIRLADVQKEVDKLATSKDRKRFHKQQKDEKKSKRQNFSLDPNQLLNGAEVLGFGEPLSKRARNHSSKRNTSSDTSKVASNGAGDARQDNLIDLNNGSPSGASKKTPSPAKSSNEHQSPTKTAFSDSANGSPSFNKSQTFIELEDLRPGALVPMDRSEIYEEEQVEETNYIVTTPSDEENERVMGDQDDDPTMFSRVVYYTYEDESDESDDSEESYGIDLMEESDEFDDEEDDYLEGSDLDFVVDGDPEESERSSIEELEQIDNGLEEKQAKRKPKSTRARIDSISDDNSAAPVDDEMQVEDDSDVSPSELNDLLNDNPDHQPDQIQSFGLRRQPKRTPVAANAADYDSTSTEDSDFNALSSESGHEEEEELDVSAGELDDLLNDYDDVAYDSDDEERIMHLEPSGLKLKPIGLTIDGYDVDESVLKCIKIKRDKSNEQTAAVSAYQLFCFSDEAEHSVNTAIKALRWLVFPLGLQDFFTHIYTRRAAVIRRSTPTFYQDVFPASAFYSMFQNNFLEYGVNINVAQYVDGVRTTHNPEGRAYAGAIRSFIDQGMSIQCVNPQSFDKNIHYLCDVLQELFNCFVGANCYYTPKGSAGFAPHYDDIDAFLIQTEGRKHWKVYAPFENDSWPLESSGNFTLEEMELYQDNLVFDGVLKAGDILYLPRGFIHCAKTSSHHDSLHVTLSVAQKHAYNHLLKKVTEKLVESKTEEIAQLRRNLPINLLDIAGVADSTYENEEGFVKLMEKPIALYLQQFQIGLSAAVPAAIDELARDFMKRALPPLLTDYEKTHTIYGSVHQIPDVPQFTENSEVRILRKHTQRLLFESEDKAFLIHRLENSMVYEGRPEVLVDIPSKLVDGVEKLLRTYPDWMPIANVDQDPEIALEVAQYLYGRGVLMLRGAAAKKPKQIASQPKGAMAAKKPKKIASQPKGVIAAKKPKQIASQPKGTKKTAAKSPPSKKAESKKSPNVGQPKATREKEALVENANVVTEPKRKRKRNRNRNKKNRME